MQNSAFRIQTRRGRRERGIVTVSAFCILNFALLLAAGGCAKAKAASLPEGPPLAMPQPPPRVITPIDGPLASTPVVPEPEVPAPVPRAPARPPARAAAPPPIEPKPEPPPVVAQQPPPATETPRPAPSPNDAADEKKVRDVLVRAARDLARVDYGRLSTGGRSQYEQAKRFNDQAEQAIKDRNYVFASTLADKAASMAAELLPR
jgi:type IV secretory pathway VirB10-like protein